MDIKQYTLEYPWVKEEIEREIKKHLETNKEETWRVVLVGGPSPNRAVVESATGQGCVQVA